jgi:hypothetical protein
VSLRVRISGREEDDRVPVTEGNSPHQELTRFLNREGPYAQKWIRLESGEYVRYESIVSVYDPREDAGGG